MCGIAGCTGSGDDAHRRALERQLATMHHRGPDSSGYLSGPGVMVGQTRLAVIDVKHGDPPLTDESGDIRVALNGEIYNFRTLRAGLQERGHQFSTACDTEVIAHLAEELSPVELARSLHGMFAFAVWDARRQRLVLGRDRLGKKPLHYWSHGDRFVFGSEIKAVLAHPRVPRRFDPTVLPSYLAYGYAPTPSTFFEGVRVLPPGHVLTLDVGQAPVVESYWDAPAVDLDCLATASSSDLAHELLDLLRMAVRDRLLSDVPLGAFLSGGVDSSAIVALMSQETAHPVRTFTIGFEEEAYDERRWARLVAERYGCDHTEVVVHPDASELLDQVLDACDQPFADSSAIPTYLLAAETRRHVTVALSGDGGDELFAGYERFAAGLLLDRLAGAPSPILRALSRGAARIPAPDQRSTLAKVLRFLEQAPAGMPHAYLGWTSYFDSETVNALIPSTGRETLTAFDELWAASAGAPALNRLLDLNRRTYLLDDLLVKADRMSMAHGLEVRSPFLDHRLVEFAVHLPPSTQLRGRELKRLLKTAVSDLVPSEILARPKAGFGVPLDTWFRTSLRSEVEAALLAPDAKISDHLLMRPVHRLVDDHMSGRRANGQRLWALLMLERFLQQSGA